MNDEEITAYHEAGHVVVWRHYRIAVSKVSIIPDDETLTAGYAVGEIPDHDLTWRPQKWQRKYITGILAGYEAVKILGEEPHIIFEDDHDERKAFYFVHDYILDDKGHSCLRQIEMDINGYSKEIQKELRKTLPKGTKTVSGTEMTEEGHELIERFRKDAHDILTEKWDQVKSLADALLTKKTLSAKDIRGICI